MLNVADPPQAHAIPPIGRDAECRQPNVDPEWFYPPTRRGPDSPLAAAPAKAVCRRCPYQPRCLGWAIETRQQFGIWGGATPAERRKLGRKYGRVAATARASERVSS